MNVKQDNLCSLGILSSKKMFHNTLNSIKILSIMVLHNLTLLDTYRSCSLHFVASDQLKAVQPSL